MERLKGASGAAVLSLAKLTPDCWCKKPGLSLFRQMFPRFHLFPVSDPCRRGSSKRAIAALSCSGRACQYRVLAARATASRALVRARFTDEVGGES